MTIQPTARLVDLAFARLREPCLRFFRGADFLREGVLLDFLLVTDLLKQHF
jgi:hypothetical protein